MIFKFRNLNTGQAMPVPPGEFLVGREDDVHVHVEDPTVSRYHAKLFNTDEGFYVEDNGSSNGIVLGESFISERTPINFGDIVYIGSVPFRVDHEVSEEPEVKPATTLRKANAAYMRRDTERLPAVGEAPRVVPVIPPDQLAAPEVNQADDMDAEDLNAITMREPEGIPQKRVPVVRPGLGAARLKAKDPMVVPTTPSTQTAPSERASQALPSPQSLASYKSVQTRVSVPKLEKAEPVTAVAPQPVSAGLSGKWLVMVFLAGMGVGLLLGLVFAKVFLEMGGKAGLLP